MCFTTRTDYKKLHLQNENLIKHGFSQNCGDVFFLFFYFYIRKFLYHLNVCGFIWTIAILSPQEFASSLRVLGSYPSDVSMTWWRSQLVIIYLSWCLQTCHNLDYSIPGVYWLIIAYVESYFNLFHLWLFNLPCIPVSDTPEN